MQAEPVDYGEWKTGINTVGSLSAINGFSGKLAQALAGGLSGLLLSISGYDAHATTQSPEAMSFYRLDTIFPQLKEALSTATQCRTDAASCCSATKDAPAGCARTIGSQARAHLCPKCELVNNARKKLDLS